MAYDSYVTEADFGPLFACSQTIQSVVNQKCEIYTHEHDENRSGYQAVLSRLKQGPLTTIDCEALVHRGQAFIRTLRRDGHIIHTKRIDGVSTYVYEKWEPVTRVTPLIKECYYKTYHWRSLAAARKEFDGFLCVQCKSKSNLETHHLRYELFEESMEKDLLTLCKSCHDSMHDAATGSQHMHFPFTITESQFLRISEAFPEVSK
jgi:5-methylcytosine-specific restriction endonuclease McrA